MCAALLLQLELKGGFDAMSDVLYNFSFWV
jgi:hypothetical protein